MAEKDSVTIGKDTIYGAAVVVLACLFVISIFTQGFGLVKSVPVTCPVCNTTCPTGNTAQAAQPTQPTQPTQAAPASGGTLQVPQSLSIAPLEGSSSHAVTVLEFFDFQCPFCGMAWGKDYSTQYASITGTVQDYETDYVKTGKANFQVMPVAFLGQESTDAADAAFCANAQGRFWDMYTALFTAQDPHEDDGKYSIGNLTTMAAGVTGMNTTEFTACLSNNTYVSQVSDFTGEWQTVSQANTGSAGTPTFYILVDASKATKDQVSKAAAAGGFNWGITSDQKTYVILASPEYQYLNATLSSLTG